MSTLSFDFETKDLYSIAGAEPTSRLLDVEFGVEISRSGYECRLEAIWDCDARKFLGDAGYALTERDLKAIRVEMERVTEANYGEVVENHRDAIEDLFRPIFSDD